MDRKAYSVHARRRGDDEWWAITVEELAGVHSQAKRFDEVAGMARDAIALMLEVPPESFDIVIQRHGNLRWSEIKRSKRPDTSIANAVADLDHNCLDEIVPLADAAAELGLGSSSLRHQAAKGQLVARVLGKTWITTRDEVERYRREHLGRLGRPKGSSTR
jgi:predicted RNase H-like HicB family nuclease